MTAFPSHILDWPIHLCVFCYMYVKLFFPWLQGNSIHTLSNFLSLSNLKLSINSVSLLTNIWETVVILENTRFPIPGTTQRKPSRVCVCVCVCVCVWVWVWVCVSVFNRLRKQFCLVLNLKLSSWVTKLYKWILNHTQFIFRFLKQQENSPLFDGHRAS
jgi:hypothetical protein